MSRKGGPTKSGKKYYLVTAPLLGLIQSCSLRTFCLICSCKTRGRRGRLTPGISTRLRRHQGCASICPKQKINNVQRRRLLAKCLLRTSGRSLGAVGNQNCFDQMLQVLRNKMWECAKFPLLYPLKDFKVI